MRILPWFFWLQVETRGLALSSLRHCDGSCVALTLSAISQSTVEEMKKTKPPKKQMTEWFLSLQERGQDEVEITQETVSKQKA